MESSEFGGCIGADLKDCIVDSSSRRLFYTSEHSEVSILLFRSCWRNMQWHEWKVIRVGDFRS